MFKQAIQHHGTVGDEDVLLDCLTGGLFKGIFAGSIGYFFKELKGMWLSNYVSDSKRRKGRS